MNSTTNTSAPLPPKPESFSYENENLAGTSALNSGMGGAMGYGNSAGGYGMGLGNSMGGYGYGSGYGGLGGFGGYGMGGYGGYGMNGYGMGNHANGMGGGGLAQSTQATFQLIESVIGAVGGFAQMLEATYMATQSSFFTMVSVGEQFGNLKNALGSIFGIFAIVKYLKKIMLKITGMKVFAEKIKFSPEEFQDFTLKKEKGKKPIISLKPLIFFVAAAFGIPYLLNKLVKTLAAQRQANQQQFIGQGPINPADIEFCRALYDFNPEDANVELKLQQGGLYAVLSKKDPLGKASKWWKCRNREGKSGYVPYNYLEVIQKKEKPAHELKR